MLAELGVLRPDNDEDDDEEDEDEDEDEDGKTAAGESERIGAATAGTGATAGGAVPSGCAVSGADGTTCTPELGG